METWKIKVSDDKLCFMSAHFITYEDGECEALHGHNFQVSVEISGPLQECGYLIDFYALRETVQEIISELDHKILIQGENTHINLSVQQVDLPPAETDLTQWLSSVSSWLTDVNNYQPEEGPPSPQGVDNHVHSECSSDKESVQDTLASGLDSMPEIALLADRLHHGTRRDSAYEDVAEETPESPAEKWPYGTHEHSYDSEKMEDEHLGVMRAEVEIRQKSRRWIFPAEECVILPIKNTTSELLAYYVAEQLLGRAMFVRNVPHRLRVEIQEAPGMVGVYEECRD